MRNLVGRQISGLYVGTFPIAGHVEASGVLDRWVNGVKVPCECHFVVLNEPRTYHGFTRDCVTLLDDEVSVVDKIA